MECVQDAFDGFYFCRPSVLLVQYYIWSAVYSGESYINGMSLSQMLSYFCATMLINYLTMDFADWNLQMLIRTGKFITFSLRPLNHMFFALSQKAGHRVLGLLFEFLPCFMIFFFIFHIDVLPANLLYAILSIAMAFMMNFSFIIVLEWSPFGWCNPLVFVIFLIFAKGYFQDR